jgi:capsule polysaccharide modification protein KpsS
VITFFSYGGPDRETGFWRNLAERLPSARWIHHGDAFGLRIIEWKHGQQRAVRYRRPYQLPAQLAGRALVVWNGSEPGHQAALQSAREHRMATIFLENAFGLPGKLQADPCGVNASSAFAALPVEHFRAFPPIDVMPSFAQRPVAPECPQEALPGDVEPLPAKYAFLPLQLEYDTQVQVHVPARWRSMATVVADVRAALPKRFALVVKLHPSDTRGTGQAAMAAGVKGVTWLRTSPIDDILAGAALVVTLNSSVGLQALAMGLPLQAGVPVVTLGKSIYSKPGLVNCATVETLREAITAGLQRDYDLLLRAQFLTCLLDHYLVDAGPEAIIARILELADGHVPWAEAGGPSCPAGEVTP